MTYIAIALFCALFSTVSASHKGRRAWLWAILGGLLPLSLIVMGFNKCFRCEVAERQNQFAHFFISVGSLALLVGVLIYESGIDFGSYKRDHYRLSSETSQNPSERHHAEKELMLRLINAERERVGVQPVKLGNNEAAQLHAEAMRDNCFISHWDRSGMKPYMRYSLHGGYQVNAENVAGLYYCGKYDFYEDVETVLEEQVMGFMESEGHRETLLDPHFRKVSIGIAVDRSVWVVQHFEGEYVEFDEMPSINDGVLSMSGRAFEGVRLDEDTLVVVEYDPPLKDISLGQLARTRCYGPGLPIAEVIQNPFSDYDLGDPEVRESVNEILDSIEEESPIVHSECRDPYKMPADLETPRNVSEATRLFENKNSDEIFEYEVKVPLVLADRWHVTDSGEFSLSADIGEVLYLHGSGVYTITMIANVDGSVDAISQYSIFVD